MKRSRQIVLLTLTGLTALALPFGCIPGKTNRTASGPMAGERRASGAASVPGDVQAPRSFSAPQVAAFTSPSSFLSSRSSRVREAAMTFPGQESAAAAPPISLTAADGTGLRLVSMRASAAVEGPLAFTELHLTFKNPRPRVIEGRFNITLPGGAAISRFAMRLPAGWQEAEVVERQQARRVYESFLHRKQDPALLEKKAGNAFRARIFPIPAHGLKEIKISYSQELADSREPYRLLLKGLPRMDLLKIQVLLGSRAVTRPGTPLGASLVNRQVLRVSRRRYEPDQDLEVKLPRGAAGLRNGNLVVARIKPSLSVKPAAVTGLQVIMDTSASRARGLAAQVEVLAALVRSLVSRHGAALPLRVDCFDQTVTRIFDGAAGQLDRTHLDRIRARRALGASNLEGALRWARRAAKSRVLLITDGVVTAGQQEGARLRAAVSSLGPATERLDVLLVGGIRDEPLMKRLVSGTLRKEGLVLDSALSSSELARRLSNEVVSGIEVQIPGARWTWPTVLDSVQPGHEVLVYADVPRGAAGADRGPRKLKVNLSGRLNQSHGVELTRTTGPLLRRAWIKARIARLEHRRDTLGDGSAKEAARVKKQIVALSTRNRVMSDHTALLVLETEADYRRFGLDRKALADIMVAGADGVQVVRRTARTYRPVVGSLVGRPAPAGAALGADAEDALGGLIGNQIGEANGVAGLGIVGTGRGGGTGEGTIGLGTLGTIGKGGGGGAGAGYGRGVGRLSGRGFAHRGEEGKMGSRRQGVRSLLAARSGARYGVAGPGAGRLAGRRGTAPRVSAGQAVVRGSLDREIIRRVIRRHINEVKYCYQRELQGKPTLRGRVVIKFTIAGSGQVIASQVKRSTLANRQVEACIASAVRRWRFPKPAGGGIVLVSYPFALRTSGGAPMVAPPRPRAARRAARPSADDRQARRFEALVRKIRGGRSEEALLRSLRWRDEAPGSILALVALGEALRSLGDAALAARAFGSIIDLYPSRADMRRFAGQRLEALGEGGFDLAADTYSVALKQRPDHLTGYRLLAYARLRQGHPARAFRVLEDGLAHPFPSGRFVGFQRVLREDMGLVSAAWLRLAPKRRVEILRRLRRAGAAAATRPSLRFVLSWETDANDVDLHVHDARGGHAYYDRRRLPSGGVLYHDVTNGYGPECFAVEGKARAYPYRLKVHYYSRGPMGYGMGKVQIIRHDGAGHLRFEDRPFVVLRDSSYVDLGKVTAG